MDDDTLEMTDIRKEIGDHDSINELVVHKSATTTEEKGIHVEFYFDSNKMACPIDGCKEN